MNAPPVAIISGGSGYLGRAIAQEFSARSWQPVSLSRTQTSDPSSFECDIRDKSALDAAIVAIRERYGEISAVVHAAAPNSPEGYKPLLTTPPEALIEQLETAALGALLLAQATVPFMPTGSAFIGVTTAFIEPEVHGPPLSAYMTAKYALRGLLRSLSAEADIRVYAVAPGYLPGGLNEEVPEKVLDMMAKKTGAGTTDATAVAKAVVDMAQNISTVPPGSSVGIPSGHTHEL